jgi:hypothetical protein
MKKSKQCLSQKKSKTQINKNKGRPLKISKSENSNQRKKWYKIEMGKIKMKNRVKRKNKKR